MFTGLYIRDTKFGRTDHRYFNRNGAMFDKGKTFSGVDYTTGLDAVEEIRKLLPERENLAPLALKWVLMFKEVSCVIPGASSESQLISNLNATALAAFSEKQMAGISKIYDNYIREQVHPLW